MPTMGKELLLNLDSLDVRDDYFPDDSFICEECSGYEEAQRLADWYGRIISSIEHQIDAQGGFLK